LTPVTALTAGGKAQSGKGFSVLTSNLSSALANLLASDTIREIQCWKIGKGTLLHAMGLVIGLLLFAVVIFVLARLGVKSPERNG
jgi:hypothetical protein